MAPPVLPPAKEEYISDRQKIEDAFVSIKGLVKASLRPLPTQTGNGTFITNPISTGLLEDLEKLNIRDIPTLIQTVKGKITNAPINDKTLLMERVVQVRSPKVSRKPFSNLLIA